VFISDGMRKLSKLMRTPQTSPHQRRLPPPLRLQQRRARAPARCLVYHHGLVPLRAQRLHLLDRLDELPAAMRRRIRRQRAVVGTIAFFPRASRHSPPARSATNRTQESNLREPAPLAGAAGTASATARCSGAAPACLPVDGADLPPQSVRNQRNGCTR